MTASQPADREQTLHFLATHHNPPVPAISSLQANRNRNDPEGHLGRHVLMTAEPPAAWILNYRMEEKYVPAGSTALGGAGDGTFYCAEPRKHLYLFVMAASNPTLK